MTKRQIKKLRERISKFIEFEIQESRGLFGDFSESYYPHQNNGLNRRF